MSWMTQRQAYAYAFAEARATGRRYRVFKSRGVIGWWNVVQIDTRW